MVEGIGRAKSRCALTSRDVFRQPILIFVFIFRSNACLFVS